MAVSTSRTCASACGRQRHRPTCLTAATSWSPVLPERRPPCRKSWSGLRRRADGSRGRDELAQVLHLVADPPRDIVGAHHMTGPLVHAPSLVERQRQAGMHGGRGGLNVERVDGKDVLTQLLMGAFVL